MYQGVKGALQSIVDFGQLKSMCCVTVPQYTIGHGGFTLVYMRSGLAAGTSGLVGLSK